MLFRSDNKLRSSWLCCCASMGGCAFRTCIQQCPLQQATGLGIYDLGIYDLSPSILKYTQEFSDVEAAFWDRHALGHISLTMCVICASHMHCVMRCMCFFRTGSVPAWGALALATPIHRKTSGSDTANDRPIAVREHLYRLYISRLNTTAGRLQTFAGAPRQVSALLSLLSAFPVVCR